MSCVVFPRKMCIDSTKIKTKTKKNISFSSEFPSAESDELWKKKRETSAHNTKKLCSLAIDAMFFFVCFKKPSKRWVRRKSNENNFTQVLCGGGKVKSSLDFEIYSITKPLNIFSES